MVSYASAPHRLEHRLCRGPRLHDRRGQPGQWPPARMVYLCAAWHSGPLAAAALVGQTAARLAPADPSTALGSPHHLWLAGAAAGHVGAWIGHLVGRRWRLVLRRVQSVELAYCPGLRALGSHRVSYARTRQALAQTRHCRKATCTAFQRIAPWQRGFLAGTTACRARSEAAR